MGAKRRRYLFILFLLLGAPALAQQHTASLTAGWNYSPNSWERYIEGPTYVLDYTWEWQGVHTQSHRAPFLLGLKANMAYAPNGIAGNRELYPAYTVELGWRYAYQHCRSLAICLEAAYNFADNFEYLQTGQKCPFPMFGGVSLMHETHWGPVSFRAGAGYHLYQSFPDGKIFERVGAFYHFGRGTHQFAGISIKANILHADFIEWSYGVDLW